MSSFTPTIEYTKAVCSCGKELSTNFYFLTSGAHFQQFALQFNIPEQTIKNMGFSPNPNPNTKTNFCCLMNLRFGIREPIPIVPPSGQDTRKYPEGLPGPLSKEKTLSWL